MKITITGATGFVGTRLVAALKLLGHEVTVLSRDAARAGKKLGVDAVAWDWQRGPAPAEALAGRDVVVHLAGEPVQQRWNDSVKARIRDSRERGTSELVAGIAAAGSRPPRLISASACAIYGAHGTEIVDETSPPARDDFLADVCVRWERAADAAAEHGVSVAKLRTGVMLHPDSGVLPSMVLPFKLGLGGPLAGGRQYLPWIHSGDLIGIYLALIAEPGFSGAINGSAPNPVTNKEFSQALGRALHRPAALPLPGFAAKLVAGDVAHYAVTGVRMVPGRAAELGYEFRFADIDGALADALK